MGSAADANLVLVVVIAYIGVQLGLGVWLSKKIHSEDDYVVGGRSLGHGVAMFTIFATWFGAETCIGSAGAVYAHGLAGGRADPFGYALSILIVGLFFAVRIWNLRLTTIADLFRKRFSVMVERTAVALLVPGSVLWAAAQIRAFGQVLSATSGIDVDVMIAAAAVLVLLYTLFGGFLADAWTDLIQGIALIVGLVVLAVVILMRPDVSLPEMIKPEQLSFAEEGGTWLDMIEAWAIPIIGSMSAAELLTRMMATRTPAIARNASISASAVYLMIGLVPVVLGLLGPALVPDLAEPEQVLPRLASEYLHPLVYALFSGALISAILSTVDSALLVSGSMLSHNVLVPILRVESERQKVLLARGGVLVFGILAYLMAVRSITVYELVEQASAFGSSGLFVILILGLFTRFGGSAAAMTSLISGVIAWSIGAYAMDLAHPFLISMAVAFAAYIVVALAARSDVPQPEAIHG